MIADKSALIVTPGQARTLARWAECARLAYNWALSEWARQYTDHRAGVGAWDDPDTPQPTPSAYRIVRIFTALRRANRLPSWASETLALTRNRALIDVDRAWRNFFEGRAGRPRPKRRTARPTFYLHNQTLTVSGRLMHVSRLGTVRLARQPRYPQHRIVSATVTYHDGRWHVAIVRDLVRQRRAAPGGALGVAVGTQTHATVSDGSRWTADTLTAAERRTLTRLQRAVSRRMDAAGAGRTVRRRQVWDRATHHLTDAHGSANYRRAVERLRRYRQRVTRRIAADRHAWTRTMAARAAVVGLEQRSARRKMRGGGADTRALNRAIGEAGWHELRRQLAYKLAEHGGQVVTVDPEETTHTCSACGARSGPPDREEGAGPRWTCSACGAEHDRDVNAARNIERLTARALARQDRPGALANGTAAGAGTE